MCMVCVPNMSLHTVTEHARGPPPSDSRMIATAMIQRCIIMHWQDSRPASLWTNAMATLALVGGGAHAELASQLAEYLASSQAPT